MRPVPDPIISEFATEEQAASYDHWFRAKVQEAIDSKKPRIPHDQVMTEMDALISQAEARRLAMTATAVIASAARQYMQLMRRHGSPRPTASR